MTNSDNRMRLVPQTEMERLAFSLIKSVDGLSVSDVRRLTALYYLPECLALNPDKASDPLVEIQIREAVHCFEARAKLIRETFPDLFPPEFRVPSFSPHQLGSSHPELRPGNSGRH